jgi:undecaprenyl-diphosphatase
MIAQRAVQQHRMPVDHVDRAELEGHHRRVDRRQIAHVARFVAVRFALMAVILVSTGLVLTYAGPLEGARGWDTSISESLASSRAERNDDVATFVSRSGDTLPIVAFGALVAAAFAARRRWRAAFFVPLALLVEVAGFAAVNYIVQRPRPDIEPVGAVPSTFSYPSGHVAATLVCWFGLSWLLFRAHWRVPAGLIAFVGAAAVGAMAWSRVYLGMHHVLDVIAGIALGISALLIAAGALRPAARDGAADSAAVSLR